MAIDPSILRAMQAAGASIDVIIAAVEADAALDASRMDDRRAKDAERQRRHRASRDVTVTERDITDAADCPLSLSPNENNSNPHTHTPEENTPARKASDFPRPVWADAAVWADFLKNRKRKRLPNTATAHKGLLEDVQRLQTPEWPPGRLLEHAAKKGWGAIYEPEEMKNAQPIKRNFPDKPSLVSTARNVAERLEAEHRAYGGH